MDVISRIIWEAIQPYLQEEGWDVWERLEDDDTLMAFLEHPSGNFFLKIDPAGRVLLRLAHSPQDIRNRTIEREGFRYALHAEYIMRYEAFVQFENHRDWMRFAEILENMTSMVLDFHRELKEAGGPCVENSHQ